MKLLLVEDDPELSRRLAERLQAADFAVDHAPDVATAEHWPDLEQLAGIILDLGLPDGNGYDLLRKWRGRKIATPILILTARGNWQDKVMGLNAGADDFVVKPVRFEELLARLHVIIRRKGGRAQNLIEAGGITLDPLSRIVSRDNLVIELSRIEYRLLKLFMHRAGHILSQSDIVEGLYSLEAEREQNTIEVQVSRLRRKIGDNAITTVRGLGYRFNK